MLSGRRLDLLEPSPFDIEIEDIAHGLSRVARWNGQTTGDWPYSVAQHSVLVVTLLDDTVDIPTKLTALLHDAPEYVIGDMISPFKTVIGTDYAALETRLMRAIHLRFGLSADTPAAVHRKIKQADKMSAALEAGQLAGFTPDEVKKYFRVSGTLPDISLVPVPPNKAKQLYLSLFHTLMEKTAARTSKG